MAGCGIEKSDSKACCDVQHHAVASVSEKVKLFCSASVVVSGWDQSGLVILGVGGV